MALRDWPVRSPSSPAAASGIGAGVVRRLAEGATVVLVDAERRGRGGACRLARREAVAVTADVSQRGGRRALRGGGGRAVRRIDLHHLNAGVAGEPVLFPE